MDPTCGRTVEEYPKGCEQRRCNVALNKNAKVCNNTTPGTTDCELATCTQRCKQHTDFTCTAYSYDENEKECQLFETCKAEGFDKSYSTYVLVESLNLRGLQINFDSIYLCLPCLECERLGAKCEGGSTQMQIMGRIQKENDRWRVDVPRVSFR